MSWAEALEVVASSGSLIKFGAKAGRHETLKTISPQRREQLALALTKLAGRPIQVEITSPVSTETPRPGAAPGAQPTDGSPTARVTTKQQALGLPMVRGVMEVFNATLIEFRPTDAPEPEAAAASPEAASQVADAAPPRITPPARPAFDSFGDADDEADDE